MPIPTRADLRAAFAEALRRHYGDTTFGPTEQQIDALAIRAAVDVVLPDLPCPEPDRLASATRWSERHRRRAEFLALADAIEGKD